MVGTSPSQVLSGGHALCQSHTDQELSCYFSGKAPLHVPQQHLQHSLADAIDGLPARSAAAHQDPAIPVITGQHAAERHPSIAVRAAAAAPSSCALHQPAAPATRQPLVSIDLSSEAGTAVHSPLGGVAAADRRIDGQENCARKPTWRARRQKRPLKRLYPSDGDEDEQAGCSSMPQAAEAHLASSDQHLTEQPADGMPHADELEINSVRARPAGAVPCLLFEVGWGRSGFLCFLLYTQPGQS